MNYCMVVEPLDLNNGSLYYRLFSGITGFFVIEIAPYY